MDQDTTTTDQTFQHSAPRTSTSHQTAKFITAALLATSMLVMSGLTLTTTFLGLAATTPLLILFSPVLVPVLVTTLVMTTGFLFIGGCGVAALVGITRLYSYTKGKRTVGTNQVDYTEEEMDRKVKEIKDLLKDFAKDRQNKGDQNAYQLGARHK